MSNESPVQQQARFNLARMGGLPMRNNVGVAFDKTGRAIRYGLMNESKTQNEQFKSSDLICPVPIIIEPHHVGRRMAIFGAFECKKTGWHLTPGDKRGQAQSRFHGLVHDVGGIAGFVSDPDEIYRLVFGFRL